MKTPTLIASLLTATLIGGAAGKYVVPEPKSMFSIQSTSEGDVLQLASNSGVVKGLFAISGATTDQELISKAQSSGTWAGLVRMVQMARGEIPNVPEGSAQNPEPTPQPTVIPSQPTDTKFWSLHQNPLRIATPPRDGSFDYGNAYPVGFKSQYNPDDNVTGCLLQIQGKNGCAFPTGPVLGLGEFTGYKLTAKEFKVYIPAGSTEMTLSGYYPQSVKGAFALKFGVAPSKSGQVSEPEYGQAQRNEKVNEAFRALVTEGKELVIVHDGGGSMRFIAGKLPAALAQGGWLYIRNLNGTDMYDIQGSIYVDLPKFIDGYRSTAWGAHGDPL